MKSIIEPLFSLLLLAAVALLGLIGGPVFAGTLTDVVGFGGNGVLGEAPVQSPLVEYGGNFYGVTGGGGQHGHGEIYEATSGGSVTDLHDFTEVNPSGENSDGSDPLGGLVLASDGNFYGTTVDGGSNGMGTIYQISPDGAFTVIYNFSSNGSDGDSPWGAMIEVSPGILCGTCEYGGADHLGTVFEVTTSGSYTVLYSFSGGADGCRPYAPPMLASDGYLYGTTSAGGTYSGGTIYKISPSGGSLTTVYAFDSSVSGVGPQCSLVQGPGGDLYGGTCTASKLFKVGTDGSGFADLHTFEGAPNDGANCMAGLVFGSDGNLYGVTDQGGLNAHPPQTLGDGVLFEYNLTTSTYSVLAYFNGTDGSAPRSSLIQTSSGDFYATTWTGGKYGEGVLYEYQP